MDERQALAFQHQYQRPKLPAQNHIVLFHWKRYQPILSTELNTKKRKMHYCISFQPATVITFKWTKSLLCIFKSWSLTEIKRWGTSKKKRKKKKRKQRHTKNPRTNKQKKQTKKNPQTQSYQRKPLPLCAVPLALEQTQPTRTISLKEKMEIQLARGCWHLSAAAPGPADRPAASLPLFWSPRSTADPSHSPASGRSQGAPSPSLPPSQASGSPRQSGPLAALPAAPPGCGTGGRGCGDRAPPTARARPGRPSLPPTLTSFGLSSGANRLIQGNRRAREPPSAARRGAAGRSVRSRPPGAEPRRKAARDGQTRLTGSPAPAQPLAIFVSRGGGAGAFWEHKGPRPRPGGPACAGSAGGGRGGAAAEGHGRSRALAAGEQRGTTLGVRDRRGSVRAAGARFSEGAHCSRRTWGDVVGSGLRPSAEPPAGIGEKHPVVAVLVLPCGMALGPPSCRGGWRGEARAGYRRLPRSARG